MESKKELRETQAVALRAMWPTHTKQSDAIKREFFQAIDRAVTWGMTAPVSLMGDMLCVALPAGSIFVMFQSPQHKAEFVQVMKVLLEDDPSARALT